MTEKFDKKQYDKRYYKRNRLKILFRSENYRKKNQVKINQRIKKWYEEGGRQVKQAWRWMVLYRLTPEEVASLIWFQNDKCAICGQKKSTEGRWKSLNIDHEHGELNRVRGLLCTFCNRVLGALERKPKILKRCKPFQSYLDNPPAKRLKIGGW